MEYLSHRKFLIVGLVTSLVILAGCDCFNKKDSIDKSNEANIQAQIDAPTLTEKEILFSVEGTPVITVAQFEDHVQKIVESNPQVAQMIDSVPSMKYNIFSGMASQELLKTWVNKGDVIKSEAYQNDLAMMHKLIEFELARKYFQEDLVKNVKVSASEVKKYYDTHKDSTPDLMLDPGGVKTVGVAFNTRDKADLFAAQPDIEKNFTQLAKVEGVDVVNFGLVTEYNLDVDKKIREKVTKAKESPSIMRVHADDKKFWICLVTEKQSPEYRPLKEVQEGIEQSLNTEKLQIMFGQKIEALKIVYQAEENKNYFEQQSATLNSRVA